MVDRRPNILVLMTDQQRWDAMGCVGNPAVRTPTMDGLATSGVRFQNAVTPTPICVAARMSFIMGHRASRTHKYAFFAQGGVEELYDLEADPHEMHNIADAEPDLAGRFRGRALNWERQYGLPDALDGEGFRVYPGPDRVPTEEKCRTVGLNMGPWPNRLPEDEKDGVESFAEAFTRAISKETSLGPEKLSIKQYKEKIWQREVAGQEDDSLIGTPWEDAWRNA